MNSKNDLISIVLPVYNTSSYLSKCIDSILNQTYVNFELIIINDGSTDNSESIIQKYLNNNKVKYFKQENKGLSEARNKGIDLSIGEYITFIDSDDLVRRDYLEKLIHYIKKYDADFAVCNLINFKHEFEIEIHEKKEEDPIVEFFDDKPIEYLSIQTYGLPKIVSWAKLFNKNLFSKIRFEKGRFHEDEFIIHKLVFECKKIVFFDLALYFYRDNPISITHTKRNDKRDFDACYALSERIEYLFKNGIDKSSPILYIIINRIRCRMLSISLKGKLSLKYLLLINSYYKLRLRINDKKIKKIVFLLLAIFPFLDYFWLH